MPHPYQADRKYVQVEIQRIQGIRDAVHRLCRMTPGPTGNLIRHLYGQVAQLHDECRKQLADRKESLSTVAELDGSALNTVSRRKQE